MVTYKLLLLLSLALLSFSPATWAVTPDPDALPVPWLTPLELPQTGAWYIDELLDECEMDPIPPS